MSTTLFYGYNYNIPDSQKDLCVLSIRDDVKQMLAEDVKGVGVVQGEDQNGCLGIFVVAGSYGGNALHSARVPKLPKKEKRKHFEGKKSCK